MTHGGFITAVMLPWFVTVDPGRHIEKTQLPPLRYVKEEELCLHPLGLGPASFVVPVCWLLPGASSGLPSGRWCCVLTPR